MMKLSQNKRYFYNSRDKLSKLIKGNNNLYKLYTKTKGSVPQRLFVSAKYFYIKQLLFKQEQGIDIKRDLNWELANTLISAVKYVPFYRNLCLGIKADEIDETNALDVLQLFPYIAKGDVMRKPELFISDEYRKERLNCGTSGGSTGQGIVLWSNREEKYIEKAFFDYKWGRIGFNNNSKIVRIACEGIRKEDEYSPCFVSGNRLMVSPYHINERWANIICAEIQRFKPDFIHSYPSCLEYILRYAKEISQGFDTVKGVFLASERVNPELLDLISNEPFNYPVVFHYGLSERTNLAWGAFKNHNITYSCEPVYGVSENYETSDGFSEIIGTSYWNRVMPLIRYRTQDYGRITDGIINNLDGREQEFLITKQHTKVSGIGETIDSFIWDHAEIFQLIQNEPGKLEIHIQPKCNYTEEIGAKILENYKKRRGQSFDMSIVVRKRIERTPSGKLMHIVNNYTRNLVGEWRSE